MKTAHSGPTFLVPKDMISLKTYNSLHILGFLRKKKIKIKNNYV